MQQRFRKLALFIGAASLAGGGLIVVACGDDNGTAPTPQADAARVDGGGPKETGPGVDTGIPDASEPDCAGEAVLRSNTATSGIFCAFYRRDAAAPEAGVGQSYCENDETCCNPGKTGTTFPPSYCADGKGAGACQTAAPTAPSTWTPDAGTSWECADKFSCPSTAPVCCFFQDQARLALDPTDKLNPGGFGANNPAHPPACNGKAMYNVGGTRCATACAANEYKVCSVTDTCGAGTTCQAVEAQFRDLGYCK